MGMSFMVALIKEGTFSAWHSQAAAFLGMGAGDIHSSALTTRMRARARGRTCRAAP